MDELLRHLASHPIEMPRSKNIGPDRMFRVVTSLCDLVDPRLLFYSSVRTISVRTGLYARDVQHAFSALEESGWLIRTGRKRYRGTIEFRLNVPGFENSSDGQPHGLVHGPVHGQPHGPVHGLVHGQPRDKQNKTEQVTKQTAPAGDEPEPLPPGICTDVQNLALDRICARSKTMRNPTFYRRAIGANIATLVRDICARFPDAPPAELAAWVDAKNRDDDRTAQTIVRRLGETSSVAASVHNPNTAAAWPMFTMPTNPPTEKSTTNAHR